MNTAASEQVGAMQTKSVIMYGRKVVLVCDAECGKAWGVVDRPRHQLGDDPNDYAFLADPELGGAPRVPSVFEGGFTKPETPSDMNRWCGRQCERCRVAELGEDLEPRSFAQRVYNQPWKHAS